MNVGSLQLASIGSAGQLGTAAQSGTKGGGVFGSVLAGMSAAADGVDTQIPADGMEELLESLTELLSAGDMESLTDVLAQLTEIPPDELTASFEKLNQSSSLEEWANSLGLNAQEMMETIVPMLEEAGLSKEELAEITFSNDLWTLINGFTEHSSEMAAALSQLLNSDDKQTQKQAADVLALFKTIETVLPNKDLLGWQQTDLAALSKQLGEIVVEKPAPKELKFAAMLQTTSSHAPGLSKELKMNRGEAAASTESPKTMKTGIETAMQRLNVKSMTIVTEDGQSLSNHEEKTTQNQSQTVQNAMVQPIVSKNVFSLETPEAKPSSQAEELLTKLQGLFKQTNFGQLGGTNRLLVKLYPEHLGQVRIELLQVNGVMTARILASTALGKQMLDSQLHQLRHSFTQQNIQVDRIDVTQAVQDPSRNDRSQQNFSQQHFKGEDEQQDGHQENDSEEQQSFQEFLVEIDLEV